MATYEEWVPLVEESHRLLLQIPPGADQNDFGLERMKLVMITIGEPDTPETLAQRISGLTTLIERMRTHLKGTLN